MKTWKLLLILVALLLPCLAMAMSDEESQRLVAEDEAKADQWITKSGPKVITKDIIIDDMRQRRRTRYSGEHILFHYGLPKIKQESYPQLAEIATAMKQAAQDPDLSQIRTFYIDGHCCIIGSAEFNCKLSWARSHAVIAELVKLGVPREKLQPRGFGFYYPAYSNDVEGTRMLNRRVESSSDVVELAAKDNRLPCNLSGSNRIGESYRSRPVRTPSADQAPRPAAPPHDWKTGREGKKPLADGALPPGFRIESRGNVRAAAVESTSGKPGSGQQSVSLPRGFIEVK